MSVYHEILEKYSDDSFKTNNKIKYAFAQITNYWYFLVVLDTNKQLYLAFDISDNEEIISEDNSSFDSDDIEISKEDFIRLLKDFNNEKTNEFFKDYIKDDYIDEVEETVDKEETEEIAIETTISEVVKPAMLKMMPEEANLNKQLIYNRKLGFNPISLKVDTKQLAMLVNAGYRVRFDEIIDADKMYVEVYY